MSEIEKAISTMEYNRHILGLPDQGCTWKPNANTIACDTAIKALQEKLERDKGCEYCNCSCEDCANSGYRKCYTDCSEETRKHYKPKNSFCSHCGKKLERR